MSVLLAQQQLLSHSVHVFLLQLPVRRVGSIKNTSPASVNKIIEGRLISACQMSQVQRENRRGELNLSCIYADPACQLLVSVTVRDSKCQSTL